MDTSLTLTGLQHAALRHHLFPGDGREALAFLLCGQARGPTATRLMVRKVVPVPYEVCSIRGHDQVTWPTEWLVPTLNEANKYGLSLVKVHSHATFTNFSSIDDHSDSVLFPSVHAWLDKAVPHGSAVMLPDGSMFGRSVDADGLFKSMRHLNVAGEELPFWHSGSGPIHVPEHGKRVAQTFGAQTYALLQQLRIGVVGCSGTGSGLIEQLARNSAGELVLIDPDVVEQKNLNRIYNATMRDALDQKPKVEVAARAIAAMGLGTKVHTFQLSLFDPKTIRALAQCDIVFGCTDSIDGRYLLNKLAVFYSIPYFDLGVKIEADGSGGVSQVCGSVHYCQPDRSSLLSRHVFNLEQVRGAGVQRVDPVGFKKLAAEGYIRGAAEDRPAVIQLNSLIASLAVNDLLARLHPYRIDGNSVAVHRLSLSHGIFEMEGESDPCSVLARHVGRGDVEPLLDVAELSASK